MKTSIVIPAYEMKGKGEYFLDQLLTSIVHQDYDNYEVVVSDNSDNDDLLDLILSYNDTRIRHLFHDKKGSSANINNAIEHATGDIIKPMFQDDYLGSGNCLSELIEEYIPNRWFVYPRVQVTGVLQSKKKFPYWNDKIIFGKNTISCPSVIAFPASADLLFDENLNWFMDVDFYYRLYLKYEEPVVLENALISVVEWDKQVSSGLSKEDKKKDLNYVKCKYKL